ncbi:MAG: V-type ATP synthase subunit F [Casimicrobiaceae bacterium]
MSPLFYIGDEATAAGFSLAGAQVAIPAAGGEAAALAFARDNAALILVSAFIAARIPPRDMAAAELALSPLTLIIPDLRDEVAPPDLAMRLRRQLGLEDPQ